MSAPQPAIAEKARQADEPKDESKKESYVTLLQWLQSDIQKKMRQEEEDDRTWRAARWQAARKAIADGTFETPERRFPVLITPDGPVSSPEKLQRFAEMESIPEALEATLIRENGKPTEKQVTICHVNYHGREKLEEKSDVVFLNGEFMVIIRGKRSYAMVVQSLKHGVTP
jgi:anti-sigma28 factor (negative regulator of flagellin synthesis)